MQKSENKKRVFGIVVLVGFETKNFFGSGLYEELSKKGEVVILRRDFETKHFDEYIKKYDLNVIVLDKKDLTKKRIKSEEILLASRRAKKRINNIQNFNYFKFDRSKKISDYVIGNRFISRVISYFTMKKITKYYNSKYLESIYDKYQVSDLIIAGYSSSASITLSNTAYKSGRKIWLIINSWKDFYVNDLIPFTPSQTFVWNDNMKEQILSSNTHIDSSDITVSGNPSFDRFFNYQVVHDKEYYAKKYNFDVERPLILYTMLSPKAYAYEKESIELINKKLIEQYPNKKECPVILLRRNPIDETEINESYFSGNNVRYADNYFEASYENAVFVQLNEGEDEWMDLLYHADININVASTVTLESLMMKTPVINIEFGKNGNKDSQLSRYSEAPFYKPLHDRHDVIIASTLDKCLEAIKIFLKKDILVDDFSKILAYLDGESTSRILERIYHAK